MRVTGDTRRLISDGSDHRLIPEWLRFAECGSTPPASGQRISLTRDFLLQTKIMDFISDAQLIVEGKK